MTQCGVLILMKWSIPACLEIEQQVHVGSLSC